MSAGITRVAGALLIPESEAAVPTEDGVLLRSKAGILQQATKAGSWAPIGGGSGTDAAWFASTLTRIQALDAALVDVVVKDECGPTTVEWDVGEAGTATARPSTTSPSAIDLLADASGTASLTLKGSAKIIPNLRTSKLAIAVRVTKVTTIATSEQHMAAFSDGATGGPNLGIFGATSTANYCYKCLANPTVNLGVAQSAVGTYDTLILWSDGTNYQFDINGAAAGTPQLASQAPNAAGIPQILSLLAAGGASGFRVDKIMVVVGPAS
jgi:hypothetical protein